MIAIGIAFIIPLVYALFKGLNAFSKTSLLLFFLVIATILFITLGVSGGINIENLKPFFTNSPTSILYSGIIVVAYNVLPLFLLLSIPKCRIENYNIKKSILFKKVAIGDFIGKLEAILSMEWIISFFVLLLVGMYFVTTTIKETFKFKEKTNKFVIIFVCLLLLIINPFIFQMNGEANDFLTGPMIIIMFSFFFVIPLIMVIGCKLKHLHNQNSSCDYHDDN